MITKKIAGRIALLSLVISLFGIGVASAQSNCVYGSSGQVFCPISSSGFFNGVNQGVQTNSISAIGGLSNFSSLLVPALFLLLILGIAIYIFTKLIVPLLK